MELASKLLGVSGVMKICIVTVGLETDDAVSLTLARGLVAAEHDVTMLCVEGLDPGSLEGVRAEVLPRSPIPIHVARHRERSYLVYQWLKAHAFDVVHLPERGGAGYYALLAKRQSLAFEATFLCVVARGSTAWVRRKRHEFTDDVDLLELEFMERESLIRADGVITFGEALVEWVEQLGYRLPSRRHVLAEPGEHSGWEREWLSWHECLPMDEGCSPVASAHVGPLVSVCIPFHDRADFLAQALASLEAQDYPNLEVIVVDDGSTRREALDLLDEVEPGLEARGWRIIRQDNLYLGAARNTAVRNARGDYVLFLDDDDIARPQLLSTLVGVARRTGADILTTFVDFFSSRTFPEPEARPEGRWLPWVRPSKPERFVTSSARPRRWSREKYSAYWADIAKITASGMRTGSSTRARC